MKEIKANMTITNLLTQKVREEINGSADEGVIQAMLLDLKEDLESDHGLIEILKLRLGLVHN